jgi:ketosteroid isomerase-like protein
MSRFTRTLFVLIVAATCMASAGAQQQPASTSPASGAETAAIRKVLDEMTIEWNKGDLEKYMTGYRNSPDITFFGGASVTKGYKETLDRYIKGYKAPGREMGKLDFADTNVQLLCPDTAFVTGRFHLQMSNGKQPHGVYTLLMKKFPEGWKIVHDHSSGE